jgi:hypothetical protein
LLKPRKIRQHIDALSLALGEIESNEPHHRQFDPSSKKYFAEQVVPSLPAQSFESFRPLLELIQKVIQELEGIRR